MAKTRFTYVDVEVGIVDIKAVDGLLEVDVGNAVGADVVVRDGAELEIREGLLDQRLGGLDVVGR